MPVKTPSILLLNRPARRPVSRLLAIGLLWLTPWSGPTYAVQADQDQERPVIADSESSNEDLEGLEASRKLGLSYRLPAGARASERRNPQGIDVLHVVDEADPPGWAITFQQISTEELGDTAGTRIDAFVASLGAEQAERVRSRETLGIRLFKGTEDQVYPAELIYLDVPLEDELGVSGLLVIQIEPTTFIYGTLFAVAEAFEAGGRETLAALFDSLRIEPTTGRRLSELGRIEQGSAVLDLFTPERLKAVGEAEVDDFYRITAIDENGAVSEVGWQMLTTRIAPKSEVVGTNAGEDVGSELGLLVTLRGEIVEFYRSRKLVFDRIASHWISFDRAEERWSTIRTPRRILQIGDQRTESEVGSPTTETGIRTRPQPRSMVTVVDSEGAGRTLEIPPDPAPYLSQTEGAVLGRLLRATELEGFEVDWYTLDQRADAGYGIRKRADRLSTDDQGRLVLETVGSRGRSRQVFDRNGARTRLESELPDGRRLVFELIAPETLLEIYREKDLPTR